MFALFSSFLLDTVFSLCYDLTVLRNEPNKKESEEIKNA